MKKFQSKDEAIFEVQIILGATVGGKITRYPQSVDLGVKLEKDHGKMDKIR